MRRGTIILIFYSTTFFILFAGSRLMAQDDDKTGIPLDHFYAEPENEGGLRKLISRIHFNFGLGYGRTFYKEDLSDFAILQQPDSMPIIFAKDLNITGGTITAGYKRWFNDVVPSDSSLMFDPTNDFLVSGDTAELIYRAPGSSIPITAALHVEFDRYKVGLGATFEFHKPGEFEPDVYEDRLSSFDPDIGSTVFSKYFILFGAQVYRYYDYIVSADAHIGTFNLSKKFNKEVIQKGIFFNLGATIEREMSEYFSLYVRPSFDLKNYSVNVPETDLSIDHSLNAFYISVGFIYRIPELRRCFIKNCTTQINHQHGEKVYRSRMHPFYKWQNPHHGQNYPKLIKYKGKNKKKLNPY